MILIVNKDTYEKANIGYIVYVVKLFGIPIIRIKKTTTQFDLVNKLKNGSSYKCNIKGFKN